MNEATNKATYPEWTARYSNEDFDRAQSLARSASITFDEARKIVNDANAYSAASCAKRAATK